MSEFANEEKMKAALEAKFGTSVSNVTVQRKNRVWLDVAAAALPEVAAWFKAQGHDHLATVTGFDEGENLGAYYHFTDTHMITTAKAKTPRANPSLPSVLAAFPGAMSYERELEDVLGIKIQGLPPGRRYPLPDDFPTDQFPLRKDWKFVPPTEKVETK
jgi:membrane-bound hydrogenase subunit beta